MLRFSVNLRPVLLDPHDLAEAVHFMRLQTCDGCDRLSVHLLQQSAALFLSPRVGIEHRPVERSPVLICHYKCLAKARHADAGDIRIFLRHIPDHFHNTAHDRLRIDLVLTLSSLYRIIPVRMSQVLSIRVKHRQFTSGCPDI